MKVTETQVSQARKFIPEALLAYKVQIAKGYDAKSAYHRTRSHVESQAANQPDSDTINPGAIAVLATAMAQAIHDNPNLFQGA